MLKNAPATKKVNTAPMSQGSMGWMARSPGTPMYQMA